MGLFVLALMKLVERPYPLKPLLASEEIFARGGRKNAIP